jgi:enterochelin esterase-like enzyme
VARYRAFYFGFYVGDGDTRFAAENAQLHRELLAAGVKHTYAHYPGSHTISFWDRHEDDWVARAVDVLTPSG